MDSGLRRNDGGRQKTQSAHPELRPPVESLDGIGPVEGPKHWRTHGSTELTTNGWWIPVFAGMTGEGGIKNAGRVMVASARLYAGALNR